MTAGRIINPMVVEGQLHGGVAQGIGQAMMEHAIWEPDSGQMISGSFMDYAMPRADTVPPYHVDAARSADRSTRSASKASAKPAPRRPARRHQRHRRRARALWCPDVPMPATPQAVWQAIQEAKQKRAGVFFFFFFF